VILQGSSNFNGEGEFVTVGIRGGADVGLFDLQIEGLDATSTFQGNGKSSYAVHAGSLTTLHTGRCTIIAGDGRDGSAGTNGSSASQSAAASAGGSVGAGGGGQQICSTSRPGGGAAGSNSGCASTGGGAGGAGGSSDTSCSFGQCLAGGDCTDRPGLVGTDGAQVSGSFGDGGSGGPVCTDGVDGGGGLVTNGAAGAGGQPFGGC
jgi:hypothetical protein